MKLSLATIGHALGIAAAVITAVTSDLVAQHVIPSQVGAYVLSVVAGLVGAFHGVKLSTSGTPAVIVTTPAATPGNLPTATVEAGSPSVALDV